MSYDCQVSIITSKRWSGGDTEYINLSFHVCMLYVRYAGTCMGIQNFLQNQNKKLSKYESERHQIRKVLYSEELKEEKEIK